MVCTKFLLFKGSHSAWGKRSISNAVVFSPLGIIFFLIHCRSATLILDSKIIIMKFLPRNLLPPFPQILIYRFRRACSQRISLKNSPGYGPHESKYFVATGLWCSLKDALLTAFHVRSDYIDDREGQTHVTCELKRICEILLPKNMCDAKGLMFLAHSSFLFLFAKCSILRNRDLWNL